MEGARKTRRESPTFNNFNQHLVAEALASGHILGMHTDISALIHHTRLSKSSLYNTLAAMEEKKFIEYYHLSDDNKRRYVKSTKLLINQYLEFLENIKQLMDIAQDRLND